MPNPFSMFDDFFSRDLTSFFGRDIQDMLQRNQGVAMPAVNIGENEQQFQIEVAAPGLRKEDFRINVMHNILTISAQQENRFEEGPSSQQQPTASNSGQQASSNQAEKQSTEATATQGSAAPEQSVTQGQPSSAMQSQPQRYTRREFSYTSFQRSFTLPESVNSEKISANYQNGILTVTVPKREEQRASLSRHIDIS